MSIPPSWQDAFMQHAHSPEYSAALGNATQRIEDMRGQYRRAYLSFSGGLDSLCCLDLVARSGMNMLVGHYDFGRPGAKASNVFPEWVEHEIEHTVCEHYGLPLHVVTKGRNFPSLAAATSGRHELATIHVIDDSEFWISGSQRIALELGCDCSVVGLRAQESIGRRKRVAAHNWISQDMPEVWPVAEWSDMDRWAHVVRYALPYSRVYDEKATIEGTYIGLRMRSLFDDGRKGISDSSMDGALFWRDRPHGR